ncbi:hypothetical protein MTO96_010700 [Rhipicephalus appendiculatus]
MAARRATGPVQAIQRGVVDRREPALLLRAPVVLGDGEGPPTIGRWAMALCEEFVQQLYQAVRAAMALLHALWIVGGNKPLATSPSSTALHQRETTDAPASEARCKPNSQPPTASGAAKQPSRLKIGPEATTARKRNLELPSSAIPPTDGTGNDQALQSDKTHPDAQHRVRTDALRGQDAPLSSSSADLATALDCKKDLPESETPEVQKLREQAGELFNAVGTVFVLLANLTVTLAYCLVRMSCARFLALVSRREGVAAAA